MQTSDPFKTFIVTQFYHFTDKRNLDLIRSSGGLFSIKELKRRQINVPHAGGNEWSHDADRYAGLDGYVHLCFMDQHPMEYRAKQDGRIDETIFLEILPEVLNMTGVLFAPDVSNKRGVSVCPIDQALGQIDFEVLYARTDWKDPKIKQRLQAAKKCELLVPDHVPLKLIRNLPNG